MALIKIHQIDFSGSASYTGSLQGTSSYAITASYALNGGTTNIFVSGSGSGSVITSSFNNSNTWVFNHNLGTRTPIITVFDSNYDQIIPQEILLNSTSSATITFPTLESGFVIASVGGILNKENSSFPYTGSAIISGSLVVTGSIESTQGFTGSLFGTSSYSNQTLSSSYALTSSIAVSASYALTSSIAQQVSTSISTQNLQHNVLFTDTSGPGYVQVDGGLRYNPNQDLLTTTSSYALQALTASFALNGGGTIVNTGSFVTTSSFNTFTASYKTDSASFDTRILNTSSSIAGLSSSYLVSSASFDTRISNTSASISSLSSSFLTFSGSYNTGSFTGSFTGSSNLTSLTAASAVITGNVTVLGTASINTLVVNQTQLSTGSNQLGDNTDDFQTLYGTVRIPTGSLSVTGSTNITGSLTTIGIIRNTIGSANLYTSNIIGGTTISLHSDTVISSNYFIRADTQNVILNAPQTSGNLVFRQGGGSIGQFWGTTGNLLLQNGGTFTDNGYKLQLNSLGSTSGSLYISGSNNQTLLKVDSDSNSNILFVSGSGRVGIGTNNPAVQLDLVGQYKQTSVSGVTGLYYISTANANQVRGVWDFYTNTAVSPDFFGRFGFKFEGGTADSFKQYQIHVANSTTPKMVVDGAGNVGIGTITPTSLLQVKGSGTTSATTGLLIQNANLSSSLVVLDNGNVGIGTSTPIASLEVRGTQTASGAIARTMLISSSLSASANSDVLVGVDINPSFNTGSYTGVTNALVRLNGISSGFIFADHVGNTSNFALYPKLTPSISNYILRTDGSNTILNSSVSTGIVGFRIGNTAVGQFFGTTGNFALQNGGTFTDNNYRVQINSSLSDSGSLYISGSSSQTLLKVDSPASSSILFVTGSGRVGIGTNNPAYTLDVTGSSRFNGIAYYGSSGPNLDVFTSTDPTWNGALRITGTTWLGTGGLKVRVGNYNTPVARFEVVGLGTTSATTTFLLQNSTPTTLMTVLDNGQFTYTTPTMTLAASQSAYVISPIITASNAVGGNYYGVNITPTFYQTTASQTQTAFRVASTFSQSSAAATLGTNIIADFGATSVGSQLTVTDVTSGSIYMVNDVSGLPIIEATSDWNVNIYNFPNIILQKTGSQVNINGTLRVSGSFILPLSQSVSPQTGSAYWSGSLLFIYDGTRYRSSSFA